MSGVKRYLMQRATWKRIIFLFLASVILGASIVTMLFGRIELDPDATMDSQTFYTGDIFYENLDMQGPEGRQSYLFLHVIDYLFISQFYFLFAYLIIMLLRKISFESKAGFLCLLPLFSGGMDFLENLFIDGAILIYPERFYLLGNLSGVFTFLKMSSLYAVFLITVILLLFILINLVSGKNRR